MDMSEYIRCVDDMALGEHFVTFMDDQGQAEFQDLRRWMSEAATSERETLLVSFILTASGAWADGATHADVAQEAAASLNSIHDIQESEVREDVYQIVLNHFEEKSEQYASRNKWVHNHRQRHLYSLGSPANRAENIVKSLESASDNIENEADFGTYLSSQLATSTDPFYAIFSDFESGIDGFGRLAAFDFLEVAHRAGEIQPLYPRLPRHDYLTTAKPKPGFKLVVADTDDIDLGDEFGKERLNALTRMLVDAGIEQCGWNPKTAMFDVESCLCNFTKDDYQQYRDGAPGSTDEGIPSNQDSC